MQNLELLLGVNWRTTVSGWAFNIGAIIVALSVLPKSVWQNPSVAIPAVLGILAKFVQDWNTKDKQVSGNGTANNPHKVVAGDGTTRVLSPLMSFATVALIFGLLAFAGCGTTEVKDSAGKTRLSTKGDVASASFTETTAGGSTTTVNLVGLSQSSTNASTGNAIANAATGIGSAATGIGTAIGASGFVKPATTAVAGAAAATATANAAAKK